MRACVRSAGWGAGGGGHRGLKPVGGETLESGICSKGLWMAGGGYGGDDAGGLGTIAAAGRPTTVVDDGASISPLLLPLAVRPSAPPPSSLLAQLLLAWPRIAACHKWILGGRAIAACGRAESFADTLPGGCSAAACAAAGLATGGWPDV
ncbi:hypothetical protein PLESTB_001106000 [Pleodorina starrii]|uniref:Uncharacterized protein n=1 Tax=Pleodorina starrii TaxID=330485 RepID=A0A9W6BR84_9CHLO|nr:hypothetical protein PLESTB_001106000 [Pleodorina starrii]